MTLEEIMKQVGGDKSDAHITIEEARMAFDSDEELRKRVANVIQLIMLSPEFLLIAWAARKAGMNGSELAKDLMRLVVETLLTEKE